MADNTKIAENATSTVLATTDEVTYSGDTTKLQVVRLVTSVTGAEGAKTINDAVALAENLANPTAILVGACGLVFDGSTWDRWTGAVTANAGTNLNTSLLALEAGGNLAAAAASLNVMDDWDNAASDGASVSGDVAHDSPDAGEPVKIGAKAVSYGATPTPVTANDRTNLFANRHGILHALGGHPNLITRSVRIPDASNAQTDLDMIGAVASGVRVVVTYISVTCDNANTADVAVKIGFGTANIPADSATGAAGVIFDHDGIPPGGGAVVGNGGGIIGIGGSGEELRMTCEDPAGGAVIVTFAYFTIDEN